MLYTKDIFKNILDSDSACQADFSASVGTAFKWKHMQYRHDIYHSMT